MRDATWPPTFAMSFCQLCIPVTTHSVLRPVLESVSGLLLSLWSPFGVPVTGFYTVVIVVKPLCLYTGIMPSQPFRLSAMWPRELPQLPPPTPASPPESQYCRRSNTRRAVLLSVILTCHIPCFFNHFVRSHCVYFNAENIRDTAPVVIHRSPYRLRSPAKLPDHHHRRPAVRPVASWRGLPSHRIVTRPAHTIKAKPIAYVP